MATDYVFDVSRLRGLGLIPSLEVPPEPVGLGREPEPAAPEPVGVGKEPEGVGQVFSAEPPGDVVGSGVLDLIPITTAVHGQWIEVYPADPSGQQAKFPSLAGSITAWLPQITDAVNSPSSLNKYVYFGMFDPNPGAAQTPGEPAGMAIIRATMSPGIQIGLCVSAATAVPVPTAQNPHPTVPGPGAQPPVGATVVQPQGRANPPPGGPTWWNYAWVYMATNGYPNPTSPPPGVVAGTGPVIGTWVMTGDPGSHHWVWFPPDNVPTLINGTWVVANATALLGAPQPWQTIPAPTAPPVAGMQGAWVQEHKGYFAFIPTAGAAPLAPSVAPATSYTWLWWVAGIGLLGGAAYLILE